MRTSRWGTTNRWSSASAMAVATPSLHPSKTWRRVSIRVAIPWLRKPARAMSQLRRASHRECKASMQTMTRRRFRPMLLRWLPLTRSTPSWQ